MQNRIIFTPVVTVLDNQFIRTRAQAADDHLFLWHNSNQMLHNVAFFVGFDHINPSAGTFSPVLLFRWAGYVKNAGLTVVNIKVMNLGPIHVLITYDILRLQRATGRGFLQHCRYR